MATPVRKISGEIRLADKGSRPLKKFNKKMDKASKSLGAVPRKAKKAGNAIGKLGKKASAAEQGIGKFAGALKFAGVAGGIALVAGALKSAISTAATFQQSLSNVLTLLDPALQKQFGKELEQGSLKIMADFGFEIETTNEALFNTISAGVSAGDSIKFLADASRLALGGAAGLDDTVSGLTSVMNAWGKETFDATKTSNAFFAAQKLGVTDVGKLASNIGVLGQVASGMNINFSDTISILTQVTKTAKSTDEATTQVKALFGALSLNADKLKKANVDVVDSFGEFRDINVIMKELQKATGGNFKRLQGLLGSIEATGAAVAIMGDGFKGLSEIQKAVATDTTSLDNAVQLQSQNMTVGMKQISGSFTAAVVKGFLPVTKAIGLVLQKMKQFGITGQIFKALGSVFKLIGTVIAAAMVGIAFTLIPLIAGITFLINLFTTLAGWVIHLTGKLIPFGAIWDGLVGIFFGVVDGIKAVIKAMAPLNFLIEGAAKLFKGFFAGAPKKEIVIKQEEPEKAVRVAGSGTTGRRKRSVNDALITKTGDIIEFNPADNILATKGNPLKGGGISVQNLIGTLTIHAGSGEIGDAIVSQVRSALEMLSTEFSADVGLN